jgi:Ser/Thr protein kinase RdoA (MazF antagonist)
MILSKSNLENILNTYYFKINQKISDIQGYFGYEINSNNYKIILSNGKIVFLKIISDFNKENIKKIELMNECFNDGIKVPKPIQNKDGDLVTILEKKLYLLTEYYKGKITNFNSEQIFSAGENLALLNKKLSKYDSILPRSPLYNDLNEEELEKIRKLINPKIENYVLINELIEILPDLYLDINDKIKSYEKNKQLVHIDYHPKNILFNENKLFVIFDFESIVTSYELQSVAFACERFSKSINDILIFLNGYKKFGKDFSVYEKKIIPYFFGKEAVNRINYILRKQFFFNDTSWNFNLDKHLEIIKRMKYLINFKNI